MDYIKQTINAIGTQAAPATLTTAYTGNSKTLDVEGMDSVDLNLYFTAAGATSVLQWKVEFSHDGTYFFGEDIKSVSTTKVTHSAATGYHEWTPGSAATHSKNVQLTNLLCKKVKISFQYATAGGTLWCQATLKEKVI